MTSNCRRFTSGTSSSSEKSRETLLSPLHIWGVSAIRCQTSSIRTCRRRANSCAQHRRWAIRRSNLPDAAVCRPRPNTRFAQLTEIRSDVFSKYHALVLQANRRLTSGLQFQTNYTLSRASDNGQTQQHLLLTTCLSMHLTSQNEDGLSTFDRRQKFVASVVYSPNPFSDGAAKHIFNGWTIAPILNAFSGQRVTGNISGSINPHVVWFCFNSDAGWWCEWLGRRDPLRAVAA